MKDPQTKQAIIDLLQKNPIVEYACSKTHTSRMTFYRWLKQDKAFKKSVDEAMGYGRDLLNDLAESQLVQSIKNGNMGSTKYYLSHNHKQYMTKRHEDPNEQALELTPEEKNLVKELAKIIHKSPQP